MSSRASSPLPDSSGSAARDAAAAGAGMALLNFLLSPQDPGWLSLNPSPWILLPLLIGIRHGFRWGFLSGASVALLLLPLLLTGQRDLLAAHPLFFLALPALGLLAGLARSEAPARNTLAATGTAATPMPAVVNAPAPAVSPGSPPAAVPSQVSPGPVHPPVEEPPATTVPSPAAEPANPPETLDHQLRALFEPGAGPVFPHLLRLLRDTAGVTDAALYEIDGPGLTRTAVVGDDRTLPAALPLSGTEIGHLAVTRMSLVTCRQVWDTVPAQSSPWLAALPWPSPSGNARHLLLVHRMDPAAVNWRTFSRIQMICRWVAQLMELRGLEGTEEPTTGPLMVAPDVFRRTAMDAAAAHREHALPSARARFTLTNGATAEQSARLGTLIAPQLRTTDIATRLPDGGIEVLLSFDNSAGAEAFTRRILGLAERDPQLKDVLPHQTESPVDSEAARSAA